MTAKAVQALKFQKNMPRYRFSNISTECEAVADARCTAIEMMISVKMITIQTHRRAGARPDLYFVILVPLCSTIKL